MFDIKAPAVITIEQVLPDMTIKLTAPSVVMAERVGQALAKAHDAAVTVYRDNVKLAHIGWSCHWD